MTPSDFDLLSAGASAEETRRLAKMLREWSDGDENGFPAQIALLTRAQWRVAATVPGSVQEARKSVEATFDGIHAQLTQLVEKGDTAQRARIDELRTLLKTHQTSVESKVRELNSVVTQVESLAKKTREELEKGSKKWDSAVQDFEQSARRLHQVIADLQSRPWRSHWVMGALLILGSGIIGFLAARTHYL